MATSRGTVNVNNHKRAMFTPSVYTKNADYAKTNDNCKHVNKGHTPVYIHKEGKIRKNANARQFPGHHSVCARVYCLQEEQNNAGG